MESHNTDLIATIAIGLGAAFFSGIIAKKIRLPVIVGYLLAGVAVGPFTPGLQANPEIALNLAEIGVALLMFGVGLHFSIRNLLTVRRLAIPGAVFQILVATGLGWIVGFAFGWDAVSGLVLGLAVSVASTVVLVRSLRARRMFASQPGRVAVGWLIVEDLFTVLALVLLPIVATVTAGVGMPAGEILWEIGLALGKAALLTVIMLVVGARFLPWLLVHVEGTESRELFTLAVLAIGLGMAFAATTIFDVSLALGAFLAGAVLSESHVSERAAKVALPMTDVFTVLFFVSVGMLLDPAILVDNPLAILSVVGVVIVGKALAAIGIVAVLGGDRWTGLTVAAGLAQIGEFSFIVATSATALGLLPEVGFQLIVATALITVAVNPLLFRLAARSRGFVVLDQR